MEQAFIRPDLKTNWLVVHELGNFASVGWLSNLLPTILKNVYRSSYYSLSHECFSSALLKYLRPYFYPLLFCPENCSHMKLIHGATMIESRTGSCDEICKINLMVHHVTKEVGSHCQSDICGFAVSVKCLKKATPRSGRFSWKCTNSSSKM